MRKRVLNVGGNNKQIPLPARYEGWEHILLDIDPLGKPDIVADARDLFNLRKASFDAIYCSHNLEHYLRHHASKVLAGFWHLVKPEGFVEIRVPDLIEVMDSMKQKKLDFDSVLYTLPNKTPIFVHDVFYGFGAQMENSGEEFYAHRCGFSEGSLRRFLHGHGFPWIVSSRGGLEIVALAFRHKPTSENIKRLGCKNYDISESVSDKGLSELEERVQRLWDSGDYRAAAAMAEILVSAGVAPIDILLLLGEYAFQANDSKSAVDYFHKAVAVDAESMQAHAGYIRALQQAGKKGLATTHFKKLEKIDADFAAFLRSTL